MTANDLKLEDFKLNVNRSGDRVSPHKPLLMLMTLSRLQAGEPRLMTYQEVETQLKDLLTKYSKTDARTQHPEFPFWRLRNDMGGTLWEIPRATDVHQNSSGDVSPAELIQLNVKGGLSQLWYEHLKSNQNEAAALAQKILDDFFPESLHDTIRQDIGLTTTWYQQSVRRRRDPSFARRSLELYRYSCAVCGYGARIGHAPLGIEAAHIKWHAYKGPDDDTNGMALCAIHHKAFDSGAIGLSDDRKVLVSQSLNGAGRLDEVFYRHHNQALNLPSNAAAAPAPARQTHQNLLWHAP